MGLHLIFPSFLCAKMYVSLCLLLSQATRNHSELARLRDFWGHKWLTQWHKLSGKLTLRPACTVEAVLAQRGHVGVSVLNTFRAVAVCGILAESLLPVLRAGISHNAIHLCLV